LFCDLYLGSCCHNETLESHMNTARRTDRSKISCCAKSKSLTASSFVANR
jgi:hypothetical protein